MKSPMDVVANNIKNIAAEARKTAINVQVTIMHIPPLRQNAKDRTMHEIHRLQVNKDLDGWAETQECLHTVALPKSIDSGAATNYLFEKDPSILRTMETEQ